MHGMDLVDVLVGRALPLGAPVLGVANRHRVARDTDPRWIVGLFLDRYGKRADLDLLVDDVPVAVFHRPTWDEVPPGTQSPDDDDIDVADLEPGKLGIGSDPDVVFLGGSLLEARPKTGQRLPDRQRRGVLRASLVANDLDHAITCSPRSRTKYFAGWIAKSRTST